MQVPETQDSESECRAQASAERAAEVGEVGAAGAAGEGTDRTRWEARQKDLESAAKANSNGP
jgi:hypothetical protein